jgi:hypothetical protein
MTRAQVLFLAAATLASAPAFAATIVPVGHFRSIELRGGGHVALHHGAAQSVTLVSGSTDFTTFRIEDGNKLVIDACNDRCPHEYDLDIDIVSPDIRGVAISGGGTIEAQGAFPGQHALDAAVEGGGSIDIRAMSSAEANAAVNGGGRIRLAPQRMLTAAVNGGGSIVYWGNPAVTQAVSGGGSIKKAD